MFCFSVPTFVSFLREIESAFDVREYCKEYLGESNATHQFAVSFLEKRRSVRPRNNAHKDDMCSPAPAITPSLQHSTEFQEVKVSKLSTSFNTSTKQKRVLKKCNPPVFISLRVFLLDLYDMKHYLQQKVLF